MKVSGYTVSNLTENTFINLPEVGYSSADWRKVCATIVDGDYFFMLEDNYMYRLDISQGALSKHYISGLTHLNTARGKLLGAVNKVPYYLLDSSPDLGWEYLSKEYSGQSFDSEIEWQSIKIAYIGQVDVEIFIDSESVLTYSLDLVEKKTTDKLLLPADSNKGLTIQFKLVGTSASKVYSIRGIYGYTNLEN
jgi:hypothetical protein